jgi:hypothetical protein
MLPRKLPVMDPTWTSDRAILAVTEEARPVTVVSVPMSSPLRVPES